MVDSLILNNNLYFNLEKDERFPLTIPTEGWQCFTNSKIIRPKNKNFIYLIKCHNHLYVGGDESGKRIINHQSQLSRFKHVNQYMQNTFNKYGIENFYYLSLVEIPEEYQIYRDEIENAYIKLFNTFIGKNTDGLNICEFAKTTLGFKLSEETRKRISASKIGHKHSLETKEKMRLAHINKTKHTEESRLKISKAKLGIPACQKVKNIFSSCNEKRKLTFYLTNIITLEVIKGFGVREFARNMGWQGSSALFRLLGGRSESGIIYQEFRVSTQDEINNYLANSNLEIVSLIPQELNTLLSCSTLECSNTCL